MKSQIELSQRIPSCTTGYALRKTPTRVFLKLSEISGRPIPPNLTIGAAVPRASTVDTFLRHKEKITALSIHTLITTQ